MQIELTRGFSYTDFQEFLKGMLATAGVAGKQVAFLFSENQIIAERMLEDVNSLLNSGEVPNLFAADELQKICDDLTPYCKEKGIPENRCARLSLCIPCDTHVYERLY